MILVIQGHLPFEKSERRRLYEEWSRKTPTVFVHPDPARWTFRRLDSFFHYLDREVRFTGLSHLRFPSVIPGSRLGWITQANRWMSMRKLLRWLKRHSKEPLVLVCQYPWVLPTFRGLPADLTVYDVVDDYVSGLDGKGPNRRVRILHERFVRDSDVVWTTSETLAQQIRSLGAEPIETRHGVDWVLFAAADDQGAAPEMTQIGYPKIGLVGRLNDRIDWSMILKICELHPEWNLVFIGPVYGGGGQTETTRRVLLEGARPENLHHLPAVRPEEMPRYFVGLDVGLIPYRPTGANLSINPLKVYQFLATGIPVVATPIPSLVRLGEHVRICSTADEFANGISQALAASQDTASRRLRKDRVRTSDWASVAEFHLEILRDKLNERSTATRS